MEVADVPHCGIFVAILITSIGKTVLLSYSSDHLNHGELGPQTFCIEKVINNHFQLLATLKKELVIMTFCVDMLGFGAGNFFLLICRIAVKKLWL